MLARDSRFVGINIIVIGGIISIIGILSIIRVVSSRETIIENLGIAIGIGVILVGGLLCALGGFVTALKAREKKGE